MKLRPTLSGLDLTPHSSFPSISPQLCLPRITARYNMGQVASAPPKPSTFHLAFENPDPSSLPRESGDMLASLQRLQSSVGRTLSPEVKPRVGIHPRPDSGAPHCSNALRFPASFGRVLDGNAVHSACQGVAWESSTRAYEKGVQEVKGSRIWHLCVSQLRNEAV